MSEFSNQRVLVVGGSSGIGLATAAAFVRAGASVTVASRNPQNVRSATGALGCNGLVFDSTNGDDVRQLSATGNVWNHVVISAARTPTGPVRGLSLEDAYEAMNSKFWGAYRIARDVQIVEGGSLTFVSGFLGMRPNRMSVLQGAINSALESLGRGLALELAPVRVNTVSPGLIETPLWDRAPESVKASAFSNAKASLPVRRIGRPEDVANAILYLASTGFATGSTVLVDGGGAIA